MIGMLLPDAVPCDSFNVPSLPLVSLAVITPPLPNMLDTATPFVPMVTPELYPLLYTELASTVMTVARLPMIGMLLPDAVPCVSCSVPSRPLVSLAVTTPPEPNMVDRLTLLMPSVRAADTPFL